MRGGNRAFIRRFQRPIQLLVGLLLVALSPGYGGCGVCSNYEGVADPNQVVIDDPTAPVARVYGAPIPLLQCVAIHTWLVIKPSGSDEWERWEVWQSPTGDLAHLHVNERAPATGVGGGAAFVIAEMIGDQAQRVVDFLHSEGQEYPCRNLYRVLPGPNSNTFTAWVLSHAAWEVSLPPQALGSEFTCRED